MRIFELGLEQLVREGKAIYVNGILEYKLSDVFDRALKIRDYELTSDIRLGKKNRIR